MDLHTRTGWYGKLPSLGDFATRRLAPDLVEAWDGWLALGLAQWRTQEPETWLQAYLDGPSWRFVLMPGVLPGVGLPLAGVLLPSVDRVGRYFPLSLMRALPGRPGTAAQLRWLHQLDDLAVDAMHEDWEIEQLEAALLQLDQALAPDDTAPLLPALQAGQACWWRIDHDGQRVQQCTAGLPSGPGFVALLSGRSGTPSSGD